MDIAPYRLHHSNWTTGAKVGLGTAFYDPERGASKSNVWFTLAQGVLTEVYYPDVAHANLRTLEFVVTDGRTFTDTEQADTFHDCEIVMSDASFENASKNGSQTGPHTGSDASFDSASDADLGIAVHTNGCVEKYADALIYRQVNMARNGKYRIEKTYITDPVSHTVLCDVKFYPLVGNLEDYQVYVYAQPIVNNGASDDRARVIRNERTYLVAWDSSAALALTTSVPFCTASVGHVGSSDGLEDLKSKFCLSETFQETGLGHVALFGQVDLSSAMSGGSGDDVATFMVVMGFGETEDEAVRSANQSLTQPFHALASNYRRGWSEYVRTLSLPNIGKRQLFCTAAMVLKAHEDKLHPGAIVASLSIPWGDSVSANEQSTGGYHLVWPRDLYQIATALISIGDTATARRALDYLQNVLQKEDGSFPQNAWLDGTPYWHGLQLDQIAFPILLAGELMGVSSSNQLPDMPARYLATYKSLVKPAADFIVQQGPITHQERWEENGGYSPSTIAAEIAGLVVAANIARQANDYPSAALYLHTADEWSNKVDEWTVSQSVYLRISDTENPEDGHWIELKNGGGWHPKSEVVDAGFLEMVRLGIKAADDPMITNSLNVVDKMICSKTPCGPLWYRYNFDGYGEKEDGSPYTGIGIGRLWPLLTGERGEYEVALGLSEQRSVPENVFGPVMLLETMEKAANCGGMIPEQVWDEPPAINQSFEQGQGTGSATPLAWSMAQYIRLGACIREGRIVEMPSVVRERYADKSRQHKSARHHDAQHRPFVCLHSPVNGEAVSDSPLMISGETIPYATVLFKVSQQVKHVQADAFGQFSGWLSLETPGEQNLTVIVYDNKYAISDIQLCVRYEPPVLLEIENMAKDSNEPRLIQYPTNPVFKEGDFDIHKVIVSLDENNVYFQIQFGNLDNPWNGPSGISKQVLDIYVDTKDFAAQKQHSTLGLIAEFRPNLGWTKLIRVTGNWFGDSHVYNSDWSDGGPIQVFPRYETSTLIVCVPAVRLGGPPSREWAYMVVVAGEHFGGLRPVLPLPSEWAFGGGVKNGLSPYIVDLLVPAGELRHRLLRTNENGIVQLPMFERKKS
jgi:glucan 1,4-alpha-glucosidase